jgi:hypothetical protein
MESFLAGTNVTVSIPLNDLAGNALVPTSLTYTVTDEAGVEVIASTILAFTSGDSTAEITVPEASNALPTNVTVAGRVVNLVVDTATGTYPLEAGYIIRAASLLLPLKNSFQNWNQAQVTLVQMQNLNFFASASREAAEGAMIEAFTRLRAFTFVITEEFDAMEQISWPGETETWRITFDDWTEMTNAEFATYPATFRNAIFRAQIAEANDILGGTTPDDRRRLGIQSETIGESSMFFRPSKPIELGCSVTAHRYLKRYIVRSVKLGRA